MHRDQLENFHSYAEFRSAFQYFVREHAATAVNNNTNSDEILQTARRLLDKEYKVIEQYCNASRSTVATVQNANGRPSNRNGELTSKDDDDYCQNVNVPMNSPDQVYQNAKSQWNDGCTTRLPVQGDQIQIQRESHVIQNGGSTWSKTNITYNTEPRSQNYNPINSMETVNRFVRISFAHKKIHVLF